MSLEVTVIVFMGPPGAGKGSLSTLCTQKLGWAQLSTGNLCRKHIAEQTEVGKQIDFAIKSGKLVSDELVTDVVCQWFFENAKQCDAVILDGYPRTLAQAASLSKLIKSGDSLLNLKIVRLSLADEAILLRLGNRLICSKVSCQAVFSADPGSTQIPKVPMKCDICSEPLIKRKDDQVEAIRERLKIYYKHEQDLLNFYKNERHSIAELNVERSLEEIFCDLKKWVGINN